MNYFAIVSVFNGLFALVAGLYVLYKNPKNPVYSGFAWFALTAALWAIFYAVWQVQQQKDWALFFMRLVMLPCYFIPFSFSWFVLTLLEDERRKNYLPFCIGVPTLFAILNYTPLTIKDVGPRLYFPYWPIPGPLMHIYVFLFFVVLFYSFYRLFQGWLRATGSRRWQLKWVTITTVCIWTGGSTNWFLWYNIPIPPIPNVFVAVFLLLLAYAIIRRQLFDVDTLADIVQEAKLSAMGTMAASINHEIRNPLFVARGLAECLLANMKDGIFEKTSEKERETKVRDVLEKTIQQINRAVDIMKTFSDLARPRGASNSPEKVNLCEVVDNVLSLVRYELDVEKIRVEKQLNPVALAYGDRKQFEEIFLNLIINACQAMPNGGLMQIIGERQNGRVRVSISDTGEGIPQYKIKRLFDPFYSTKGEKGNGLGLYIVKKLMERNGGTIQVASRPPNGTTFTVEFNVADTGSRI